MLSVLQILHIVLLIAIGAIYTLWVSITPDLDFSERAIHTVSISASIVVGASIFTAAIIYGVSDTSVIKGIFLNNYRRLLTKYGFVVFSNILLCIVLCTQLMFIYSYRTVVIYSDQQYDVLVSEIVEKTQHPIHQAKNLAPGTTLELRIPVGSYSFVMEYTDRISSALPPRVEKIYPIEGSFNFFSPYPVTCDQ